MPKINALQSADTLDELMTKLEAFGDHFAHLATTADQRELATRFNAFVGELSQAMLSPAEEKVHVVPATHEEPFHKPHGHETLAGLFAELRADEAAAKSVDAHSYRTEAFKKILDGKTEPPAAETVKDKEIER